MSIFKEFFTPKQEREPGPPLSVVLHPFYPQSLLLPGYEPLTIPFDQILGIFFGVTAIVFIVVWLASGASLPFNANLLSNGKPMASTVTFRRCCRLHMQVEFRTSA